MSATTTELFILRPRRSRTRPILVALFRRDVLQGTRRVDQLRASAASPGITPADLATRAAEVLEAVSAQELSLLHVLSLPSLFTTNVVSSRTNLGNRRE